MEKGGDNSTIRQRIKSDGGKRAEMLTTATDWGKRHRFPKWMTVCFWLFGTFAIGITLFWLLRLMVRTYHHHFPPTSAQFQKELGRECDDGSGKCIVVADISEDFGKTWGRCMMFVDKSTFAFEQMLNNVGADVLLKCRSSNAKKIAGESDVLLCTPDHNRVSMAYVATMVLMPFVVGALRHPTQMDEQSSQSALVIGLGGGTLDMFLHKKAPNLNITIYELNPLVVKMAHKWFGTVEDSTRRTLVGDGLVAIEKAAENGEQFDLVALDACDMFGQLVCPAPALGTDKALKNIKAILKPTGTFMVNIIADETADLAEQKRRLLNVFPTCLHTMFVEEMSNVFVCLPVKMTEHAALGKEWEQRREELAKEFGIGETLANYRIE